MTQAKAKRLTEENAAFRSIVVRQMPCTCCVDDVVHAGSEPSVSAAKALS